MELTREQILAYRRYAMGVVVSANREWSERYPREPELGFTRERLHEELLSAALAARYVHDCELGEHLSAREHCERLYQRCPGWLRLEAHWIVTRAMNERIGRALART